MAEPGFWDRKELAQKQVEEVSTLRNKVGPFLEIERHVDDVGTLKQLADEEPEGESKTATLHEFGAEYEKVEKLLADFELKQLMSGENDRNNCFLTLNSGAGGTESCDWADMLLRMYTRWIEGRGFKSSVVDIQPGEEAGIKSATLKVTGEYAFGYLSCERGV